MALLSKLMKHPGNLPCSSLSCWIRVDLCKNWMEVATSSTIDVRNYSFDAGEEEA